MKPFISRLHCVYIYVQNNPVNFVDPLGLWSIIGGAGGQAGFHAGFVGINGSTTAMMGTDQQGCADVTVCLRVGPGLYAGAGGLLQVGGARNNTQDVGGWSVGLGGDIGYGPSMGGQITGSTSALVAGKGKWGGGGGISGGIDFCWTEVKCTEKCQDK